jgi:hypothetical protein
MALASQHKLISYHLARKKLRDKRVEEHELSRCAAAEFNEPQEFASTLCKPLKSSNIGYAQLSAGTTVVVKDGGNK